MQSALNISNFDGINKKLGDIESLTYQEVGFKSKKRYNLLIKPLYFSDCLLFEIFHLGTPKEILHFNF